MARTMFAATYFFFFASQILFGQERETDTKCGYMLIGKSVPCPITDGDIRRWKPEAKVEYGHFDKLTTIPSGKWIGISAYGSDKKQRADTKGQVNLAPLDRFNDGELFIFSCSPNFRVFIRDADLIKLSRFKSLRGLGFAIDDGFTDARILGRFKNLDRLVIYDPQQRFWKAKEAAATLGSMGRLRGLVLNGSPCDDDAMQAIGKLKRLEALSLSNVNVTDRGLKAIQAITSLREIDLHASFRKESPGITDEGLAGFAKLKKLETLTLGFAAYNVSDKAIEALRAKFPNAKIRVFNKRPKPKR